jgi:hypothetical protein
LPTLRIHAHWGADSFPDPTGKGKVVGRGTEREREREQGDVKVNSRRPGKK